jgi:hypothetical protein
LRDFVARHCVVDHRGAQANGSVVFSTTPSTSCDIASSVMIPLNSFPLRSVTLSSNGWTPAGPPFKYFFSPRQTVPDWIWSPAILALNSIISRSAASASDRIRFLVNSVT